MGNKSAVVFGYRCRGWKDLIPNILSNILLTWFVVSEDYALGLCSFYCMLMIYSSHMDNEEMVAILNIPRFKPGSVSVTEVIIYLS